MPMCYYKVDAKNIYDTGLGDSFVLWLCQRNRDTCCDCLWFLGRYKTLKVAKEYGNQFGLDYLVITKGNRFICDRDRGERTTDGWKVPKWEKIEEHLSFEYYDVCFSANCETDIHKMNVLNKEIVSK